MDNPKVQFVKRLEDCIINNLANDSFIIYKNGYKVPNINGISDVIEFDEFKRVYHKMNMRTLVFFGFNQIMTPSNRCDFIFEYLFNLSTDVEKISIDYAPFIGEPWRLWGHYGLTKSGRFDVPYSYTIETEWKHWFYRNINCSRFEPDNLRLCLSDTYSNLELLSYSADFYEVSDDILKWYDETKEDVFLKYGSPKLIINNLLKLTNKKFNLSYSFDSYRGVLKGNRLLNSFIETYRLPNLGIYKFVDEENKRRCSIYNVVVNSGRMKNEK